MSQIGRHIVIYGPTGSGKTYLALKIAQSIGIPHIELDAVFWLPEWQEKPLEQFREDVSSILNENTDGWVFDGNYGRVRDLVLPLADTVVWLRLPFRVIFWYLFKRTISRARNKEILWGSNRESWQKAFFSLDSLFLYVIKNWKRYTRKITRDLNEIPHQASVIELHSLEEVDLFLTNLESTTYS